MLGTDVVVSHIHRLSCVLAPADLDRGGIMTLSEGGTASPSSSDDLDTIIYRLWGWAVVTPQMLVTKLSSGLGLK